MRSAPDHRADIFHPMVSVPSEYLRLLEDVAAEGRDVARGVSTGLVAALGGLEAWQTLHDYWPRKPPEPAA